MEDVYKLCPIYKNSLITLRQTVFEDAKELLKCYSDDNSVPFFNSDNCNGDNFHYKTIERLQETMKMWNFSYKNRHFVRWSIIFNNSKKIIGTIEMFHRHANDEFNHYGLLRIDLKSNFETQDIISSVLKISNENFYTLFDVKFILTKSIPEAKERLLSLRKNEFVPLGKKLGIYDHYFVRSVEKSNPPKSNIS